MVRVDDEVLDRVLLALGDLERAAARLELDRSSELECVPPHRRGSARNLIHYLAVRQHDIRDLQRELSGLGLSSLGRMESHVAAQLHAVQAVVSRLSGRARPAAVLDESEASLGAQTLAERTAELLGPRPDDRTVRTMVTMPSEAAHSPELIEDLLRGGMNVMRINCAHDGPSAWAAMATHLRNARDRWGLPCKIMCDLAGPKLRTGPIAPGPEVVRWKPRRNELGEVLAPARITFHPTGTPSPPTGVLPLDPEVFVEMRVGDRLDLTDARGRSRSLDVVAVNDASVTCECPHTGYVTTGMAVTLRRDGTTVQAGHLGWLPPIERALRLSVGDTLIVTRSGLPGRAARIDDRGRVLSPARIGCSLDQALRAVRVGHRAYFDDGKFKTIVRETADDHFVVEVVRAGLGTANLWSEKGINLPDTHLDLPALTERDRQDLDAVVSFADLVALSFVHHASDVDELHEALQERQAGHLGKVLKVETRQAFEQLPSLLLASLRYPPVAVMIARGDLSVEVGFERLAEVQEETLWLCEAAHIPVIWATQVLESLAKQGLPSRSEVTDAAMASRAECVMLNKGPHVRETLRFLCNVLRRMQDHQVKKFSTLRKLQVSVLGSPDQPL